MKKVYARNCEVISIPKSEGKDFIEKYHSQGNAMAIVPVYIGLFHGEELLAITLFSNPRTLKKQKDYSRELLRMCFKSGVRVIGGASKMIRFYIDKYNPDDFFTYQDTTGKNSAVYEKSGMKQVKDGLKTTKQYLVAPGKTVESANRKECLGMAYATRYGPDRILGTKIGEIYKENKYRKSNRELFLEELGWHVEETTGDSVYEWTNENLSFYVYKTTSLVDDGYYIGRRKIRKPNASEKDCLKDKYIGSGGLKFQNWISKVGKENVKKEILFITDTKKGAVKKEKKEIGDLYLTDKNCKNSYKGGLGQKANNWADFLTVDTCEFHGKTKFFASFCYKCRNEKLITMEECLVHGETKHQAGTCSKCNAKKNVSIKKCLTHGETKFIGESCYKCYISKQWSLSSCPFHGKTKFQKGVCKKCSVNKSITSKTCTIHGKTSFYGDSCYKCHADKLIAIKVCSVHGETKFIGESCYKCSSKDKDTIQNCQKHGKVAFLYSKCTLCIQETRDTIKPCSIHGETKHRGDSCYKCTLEKANFLKVCSVHGETKFRGDKCCKCSSQKAAHKRFHVNAGKIDEKCPYCAEIRSKN